MPEQSVPPVLSYRALNPRPTANPRRILVVEDNLDSVRSLSELVRDFGHHTRYAINGYAALEIARGWKPDFVLLDLGLPGMDGYEVCKRLKYDDQHARIIAVTAYGDAEHRARSKVAGFELHLVKPVAPRVLFDVLESAPGTDPAAGRHPTGG